MPIEKYSKSQQGYGEFNGGEIVENKPIGFPQESGGGSHPYSNLFYWAHASSSNGSTIGEHPHQAFEILSFVLSGDIEHYDNHNNKWFPLSAGDVQVIKAGSGIYHAEKLNKNSSIFQIWFNPDVTKTLNHKPEYTDYKADRFTTIEEDGISKRVLIGSGSPIHLESEGVEISELKVTNDITIDLDPERYHSFYVLSGSGKLDGESVVQDDFVKVFDVEKLEISEVKDLKLFYISNPKVVSHRTYYQSNRARYN